MRRVFYTVLFFLFLFLAGCNENETGVYNGYIDADLVYLSANYSGRLIDLSVTRGAPITKNEFLFSLEEQNEQYNLGISKLTTEDLTKQRDEILSKIHLSKIQLHRAIVMRKQNAASQESVDSAKTNLSVLEQQLAALNAKINSSIIDTDETKWRIKRKKGYAPQSGIVFDTYYFEGEYVPAGNPVVSLITPQHIKIVFFVPEKQLATIRLNQKIKVSADGNHKLASGKISYISKIAEYTPPIIYSREERQRLVFRVEAKIDSADLNKIHLGQPVSVKLS